MSKYSENMPPSLQGAVEWMLDEIKPGSTFLDFGCSTGYFGKYLKDTKNCTVYGVEISEDIEQARKVLDGVYSFDLDGLWPEEIYERKYDYLFYGDVLEHLKDPGLALQKSKKLLKPGGKIFVSIPNVAHLSIRLELLTGSFRYEPMGILDNTHLKYFTLSTFNKLANDSGYKVAKVDFTVNEYPKEIVRKLLEKAGLEPLPAFWKITNTTEAKAFQYKFVLVPQLINSKKVLHDKAIPPIKPEQYKENFIADLNNQIKALDDHAKEQAKIIEYYKKEMEESEKQKALLIKTLENSFTYKIKRLVKGKK